MHIIYLNILLEYIIIIKMGKEWVILSEIFIYIWYNINYNMRRVYYVGNFTPQPNTEADPTDQAAQYSECYRY